jgi:hypothetical protein
VHLVVDSFSRRHFFRKLPVTVDYLNELNKGADYRVFDFKLHNIRGKDSIMNQFWLFGDKLPKESGKLKDNLGDKAIWN